MNLFDRNLNCVILTLKVLITTAAHTILHFYPHAFFKKKSDGDIANASIRPSVLPSAHKEGYLCGCRLWIVSMYLGGIYFVRHLKFDLMWLKSDLMWLFSNHRSVLFTCSSHITVHSLECPSIRLSITLSPPKPPG